jgi:hypothetical protein
MGPVQLLLALDVRLGVCNPCKIGPGATNCGTGLVLLLLELRWNMLEANS